MLIVTNWTCIRVDLNTIAALPEVTLTGPPTIDLEEGAEFSCWSPEVGHLVWALTDPEGAEIEQELANTSHTSQGLRSTLLVKSNSFLILSESSL